MLKRTEKHVFDNTDGNIKKEMLLSWSYYRFCVALHCNSFSVLLLQSGKLSNLFEWSFISIIFFKDQLNQNETQVIFCWHFLIKLHLTL